MTTNKPEVVAWIKETWRSATESRPVVHDWEGNGSVVSPLVRLSDYEALQAECKEEIYRALQYRDAHFEALLQALEQVDAMKAECEKLRALLLQSAPIIHAHAGASHMLEGFKRKRNKWDALVEQIDAAMTDTANPNAEGRG